MTEEYDSVIGEFITRLRSYSDVEVTVGQTSTVMQGEYQRLFQILEMECRKVLSERVKSALVIKILNTARYYPT